MSKESRLTETRLRELLNYDPATGVFVWKPREVAGKTHVAWNQTWAHQQAGTIDHQGRVQIVLGYGWAYRAHRLAFLYMTGRWPKADIDHVNSDPADNRWANLREATRSQNLANGRHKHKNKGADKLPSGRWRARISVNGNYIKLGVFNTRREAVAAYRAAAAKHFGEFQR